ncbi:hypothetical protein LCGC14_1678970, partial [marine sediment metagenome]
SMVDHLNESPDLTAERHRITESARVDVSHIAALTGACVIALVDLLEDGYDLDSLNYWLYSQFAAVAEGVDIDPVGELNLPPIFGKQVRFLIREILTLGGDENDLCKLIILVVRMQSAMFVVTDDGEPDPTEHDS